MENFIPYAHQSISEADLESVSKALMAPIITRGPYVEQFEKAIAEYCGAELSVAFNSGSTALIAACHAAQLSPYDHLISTPNTFVATVHAALRYGVKNHFVDIDLETGNFDLNQVAQFLRELKISRGKVVVMPVHFSGIPVDMQRLSSSICQPETVVIEDAAHALGSKYKDGSRVGSCAWSDMTIFSFHPAKTITTGEGGLVTTNDPELYRRLLLFRNNSIERNPEYFEESENPPYEGYYEVMDMTGNYHMTEFQAALGLSQLQRIDQFIEKRQALVSKYRELFKNFSGTRVFSDAADADTAFHLFVTQIDFDFFKTTRAKVMVALKEKEIGTQVHYIPVYHHPFIKKRIGEVSENFPNMEKYFAQALSLPLYFDLSEERVGFVVETLRGILESTKRKSNRNSRR